MTTQLQFLEASTVATPLLAVFAVDIATGREETPLPTLMVTTDAISDAASRFLQTGEFKAGIGEVLLLHAPHNLRAERLLIIGLGKVADLTCLRVRQGAGTAVRAAMARAVRDMAIHFPEERALSDEPLEALPCIETACALAEGLILGAVDLDSYKSDRKDRTPASVTVLAAPAAENVTRGEILQGFDEGVTLAEAQNVARTLVNEPGNVLTPSELARRTAEMAERVGLHCEVYSTEKLQELKMGAFLGVAQGSAQPPALVVLRYEPETATEEGAPVLGLVGKGITFDTGGISIKPADGMEKMKNDMGGAAAMIGAMQAIATLKPTVRVLAVLCCAENMPDGKAYRPGDVLTAMSGTTIEVMNTDAEGRLVLADGLHYAVSLGATHLMDAATLTGACVVALGRLNAGLFSNDEDSCSRFLAAMRRSGEGFWRLPCTDEYRDLIKSQIADIQNTGVDRWGGAITAAMFLKEFVGEVPWIHLDIAGQAVIDDVRSYIAKGASGFGVRSIVGWVRSFQPTLETSTTP